MCGIIGQATRSHAIDTSWIERGMKKISHRGPDANGIYTSDNQKVVLGHQRLSIFDLSEKGRQPMSLVNKGVSITFNGEIFNFRKLKKELTLLGANFESKSDTEVILYAYYYWGDSFLDKIKGQFAFAIFDQNKNRLLLARDISGEKPLFYYLDHKNSISFASEIKGLFENPKIPRKLNKKSFHYFLQNGYVPSPNSMIENINKLKPGSALSIDINTMSIKEWTFWDLPDFEDSDINLKDTVDHLHKLLSKSVDLQLEADVPVGVLLSGGVDSSIITGLSAEIRDKVKTYTVIFPNDPGYNEQEYAKKIAEHFSTDHTELEVDVNSFDIIEKLAYQYDEPMIDSSMIPTFLLSKEIKKHCTVALGGDGGDELFGGYHHHARFKFLQQKFSKYPAGVKSLVSKSANHLLPIGFKGRNWASSLNTDFDKSLPHNTIFFDDEDIKNLLNEEYISDIDSKKVRNTLIGSKYKDIVQRSTRFDFKNYLCEDILVKVDRASMLNSLEMRSPFLDKDVINFAYKYIPSSLKANSRERKIILQKLSKKILPSNYDSSRKQGFSIPLKNWLQTPQWKELISTYLLDKDSTFNKKEVEKILFYQQMGFSNSERIFGLLMFEIWKRYYKVSI